MLGKIFNKRETIAASKTPVVVERPSKRGRNEDGSPIVEKIPSFLVEKPVRIDEDPNPFVVKWGLLNKDTIVGSSQAAAEWSRNVITPRDMAEVVECADDAQIELMGSQALAAANTYHQASLHNLREVRAEKAVAERDRDRYFSSSQANFERFRVSERELVEAQEKIKQFEAQLLRAREETISEYKSSKEFDDLLSAEYDSNFPYTFKQCWEEIIGELGSKIEGVTLEKFPVPDIPGLQVVETATTSSHPVGDSGLQDDFIEDVDAPHRDASSPAKDPLDDLEID